MHRLKQAGAGLRILVAMKNTEAGDWMESGQIIKDPYPQDWKLFV